MFQANNVKSDTYTGVYYLDGNIHIRNGATLDIDGNGDGACETLLIVRERETDRQTDRQDRLALLLEDTLFMNFSSSFAAASSRSET